MVLDVQKCADLAEDARGRGLARRGLARRGLAQRSIVYK